MKTRLTHVRANVRNLPAALEWYRRILEFEVKTRWPPEQPQYADFALQEGAAFAIREIDPVPTGGRFNFTVDDIDGMWDRVKDKVDIVEAIYDPPHGTRTFTIRDLDGNELGFVQGA